MYEPHQEQRTQKQDRITRFLTEEDVNRLRDLHYELAPKHYDLAEDIEHLGCYLGNGPNASCSMNIDGTDKKIIVKPELRLETRLADSRIPIQRIEDHPDYDPHSVGGDSEKQRIDAELFEERRSYIEEIGHDDIVREDILSLEIRMRNKDVRDHRLYLWQEMHRQGNSLYGKLPFYGSEEEGVLLTIATAHWLKEQGPFFCSRAEEHYFDMGIPFKWHNDMERAVVLEVQNGETKHYPIVTDQLLINDGIQAQIPMAEQICREGDLDILGVASMTYRRVEEDVRNGNPGSTGVFVISGLTPLEKLANKS